MENRIITAKDAAAPIGPYSHAVQVGNLLFTSGQIPLDVNGNKVEGDVKAQTKQVMENVAAILRTANTTFANVVKTTIFLKDLGDFVAVNEIYGSYFAENPPARSCVQVAALPKDCLVEIEVIANLG